MKLDCDDESPMRHFFLPIGQPKNEPNEYGPPGAKIEFISEISTLKFHNEHLQ